MPSTVFREKRLSIATLVLAVGIECAVTGLGFSTIMGFPAPQWFLLGLLSVIFGEVPGALLSFRQ